MEEYSSLTKLDEGRPQLHNIPGFLPALYDYQASDVYQAVEYIKNRYKFVFRREQDISNSNKQAIFTDSIHINEPYGTGKTVIVLAILCAVAGVTPKYQLCRGMISNKPDSGQKFVTEIYKKHAGIIGSKVILVGSNVLIQWKNMINSFTTLTSFIIGDLPKLREFYEIYKNNGIIPYDIIVLRNGNITQNFFIDGDEKNYIHYPIIEIFGLIVNKKAFQIVVYDDFDTINIDKNTKCLNSLFNIFVSSTNKPVNNKRKVVKYYGSIKDLIRDKSSQKITSVYFDKGLNNFRIISDKKYIDGSLNLPTFTVYKCTYECVHEKYMRLIGAMKTVDAEKILQALNGDAPNTAAAMIGIDVNPDPGSIFERLLDKQWNIYRKSGIIVRIIDSLLAYSAESPQHPAGNHSFAELEAIEKNIINLSSGKPAKVSIMAITTHKSAMLLNYLNEMKQKYELEHVQSGLSIKRVKENIRDGSCSVCCLDLKDDELDIVIVKCCSLILCGNCLKNGCDLYKNIRKNGCDILGTCPNPHCGQKINILRHIVYVSREIDIDKLLDSSGLEDREEISNTPENISEESDKDNICENNPKLLAIYKIINGELPENTEKVEDVNFVNIITGNNDVPDKSKYKKILLFAGYDETLCNIEDFFGRIGTKYFRLRGSFQEKHKILQRFKDVESNAVLIADSQENCAGMDGMQTFVTDLIYYHEMERSVMGQVAGRLQRMGRTFSFNIFFLLYINEKLHQ